MFFDKNQQLVSSRVAQIVLWPTVCVGQSVTTSSGGDAQNSASCRIRERNKDEIEPKEPNPTSCGILRLDGIKVSGHWRRMNYLTTDRFLGQRSNRHTAIPTATRKPAVPSTLRESSNSTQYQSTDGILSQSPNTTTTGSPHPPPCGSFACDIPRQGGAG